MTLRVVTTCNREGFEAYGHRALAGWKNWPTTAELWFYAEQFKVPETSGVRGLDVQILQELMRFKDKYRNYEPVSFLHDVVRFSHKVFAAIHALYDHDDIGVWLDADCVTYKPVSDELIRSLIPADCYMAMFKRNGLYTETGFWVVNCAHEQHKAFLDVWREWYEQGVFKNLDGWTDCHTLDATVRKFEKSGLIKTHNLSGTAANKAHPMSFVEIGKYIDHCKGQRKIEGISPENEFHKAAA